MTRSNPSRRGRILSTAAIAVTASALAFTGAALAVDGFQPVPAPPAFPTSADQIQNIDQVRTAIKGYYGDKLSGLVDPVSNAIDGGDKPLHTFSDDSAYANEVGGIAATAQKYLRKENRLYHVGQKAVLFDVDDTTLNTYDFEIYTNFVFSPSINAAFVDNPNYQLRAVPHMVDLESWAASHGYAVFFLTGRPIGQLAGTLDDLHGAGYVFNDANVYTKDLSAPWLSSCAPTCSTTQYKSLTRQHIQSLGYEIVANFGDQFSDLNGGFADNTFKIPNPMYFLP